MRAKHDALADALAGTFAGHHAMLDRLLHRSVVLNITGESYRMRADRARAAKLRAGDGAP